MTIQEAIKVRHSVRAFLPSPIPEDIQRTLQAEIDRCNREGGLHIRLVTDDPSLFDSRLATYGKFRGVRHCLVLSGPKADDLNHRCGYYGERLVLLAQTLGLNTCWVVLTFSKKKTARYVPEGDKLVCVIAIGYGETQGHGHKIKSYKDVCDVEAPSEAFRRGVEAALLAPTAVNQQRFKITLVDGKPVIKALWGFYSDIDLGIVKLHFELGSESATHL
jgi:nitroreductase